MSHGCGKSQLLVMKGFSLCSKPLFIVSCDCVYFARVFKSLIGRIEKYVLIGF